MEKTKVDNKEIELLREENKKLKEQLFIIANYCAKNYDILNIKKAHIK